MADVSVREGRVEDADRVAQVQRSTWRQAYRGLLPQEALDLPVEQLAQVWRRSLADPPAGAHLFVAVEGTELVGLCASGPSQDQGVPPRAVELTALLVEPRSGRRGHGSRLLAASVQAWQRDGSGTAYAWAFQADAATSSFLDSAGWRRDGAARGLDTGAAPVRQLRWHADVRP